MVTLFFFYRDGDTVIQQAEFVVRAGRPAELVLPGGRAL